VSSALESEAAYMIVHNNQSGMNHGLNATIATRIAFLGARHRLPTCGSRVILGTRNYFSITKHLYLLDSPYVHESFRESGGAR